MRHPFFIVSTGRQFTPSFAPIVLAFCGGTEARCEQRLALMRRSGACGYSRTYEVLPAARVPSGAIFAGSR